MEESFLQVVSSEYIPTVQCANKSCCDRYMPLGAWKIGKQEPTAKSKHSATFLLEALQRLGGLSIFAIGRAVYAGASKWWGLCNLPLKVIVPIFEPSALCVRTRNCFFLF